MSTTLASLVSDVRLLSGLRANQLYTDADIGGMLSDLFAEVYDRFVITNQHYRIESFEFTLAGGVTGSEVDLPSNFQLGNGLELNPSYPRPQTVKYLDNWLDRNNLGASVLNVGGSGLVCSDRQYCFSNNQLKVFPVTNSAGSYRLWYTPMADKLQEPTVVTAAIDASDSNLGNAVAPGPGSFNFANIDFTGVPTDGTATVATDFDAPNDGANGTWYINGLAAGNVHGISVTVTVPTITGPAAGSVTLTYQPANTLAALPDYADPWAIYLKLGASIAIREARQQDVSDLERRFGQQKLRVDTVLQNRQEEATQPPLTGGRSFWDSL